MRNFRGIIIAAIFAVLTKVLLTLGEKYTLLIGMAYPFASKTLMEYLGLVVGKTQLCVWQIVVVVFLIAVVTSFGLMILFRWNFFRWLGSVLAPVSIVAFLFVALWGLNNFSKPVQESMKLDVPEYTVTELKEAALFFRRQADRLAPRVDRDENGDVILPSLEEMNTIASNGYDNLVWEYSVFAGPRGPVKALGFPELFSRFGISGVTVGITGEAAVNMDSCTVGIPFDMCHEMGHLDAIARENEANFAAYLACEYSQNTLFRYSGFLRAFVYCSNTLADVNPTAWREVWQGATDQLVHDVNAMHEDAVKYDGPVKEAAQTANDTFLKASGQEEGTATYDKVTDLLVAWYRFKYVVDDTPKPTQFDPFNYDEVFPTEPAETLEPEETEAA